MDVFEREYSKEEEEHITKKNIYEYLVLNYNHIKNFRTYYKLAGAVTQKQTVLGIGAGDITDHIELVRMNLNELKPNDYLYETRYEDNVQFYAYEYNFGIILPDKISNQQYEMIKDIIRQVRKFEKDYNIKIKEQPKLEDTLSKAKEKLSRNCYIEHGEKIVGSPIDEKVLIDSLKKELDISNCNNNRDLQQVAWRISVYYNDDFYRSIIEKIIPNASNIVRIYDDMFMVTKYLDSINLKIENLSFGNLEDYLNKLLLEAEKKREAENFDMMYNEALKENEEFNRKKHEEEVRQYSEMYEQALKENEEFDRRQEKLSNSKKSLLDSAEKVAESKEKQNIAKSNYIESLKSGVVLDVKNAKANLMGTKRVRDKSEEIFNESVSNFKEDATISDEFKKKALKEAYQKAKIKYEEVSSLKKLNDILTNSIDQTKSKEEIDKDLDYFENEERKINDAKKFNTEQKKKMIDDLYSEFDEYVEQNPEKDGRQM